MPSGNTSLISASALASPSSPPSSYCLSHLRNAASDTLLRVQKSLSLIRPFSLNQELFFKRIQVCHKSFSFPVDGTAADFGPPEVAPPFGASPLSPEATSNNHQSYNFQSFSTLPCLLFRQQHILYYTPNG